MDVFYLAMFFIFGCIMGSFYNVVGYRLSIGKSLLKPRSHCPKCDHELKWYELIPIFSFVIQNGKCRQCKNKISIFYPMIELLSGILFMICFYSFGFSYELFISICLSSLLMIVVVSDFNFYIIPDEVNLFFAIIISIGSIINFGFIDGGKIILNGIIMFGIMYLLMKLGKFLFKKESLGGGDVKLMFVLGMCLPLILSFLSVALAAVIALPISIIILFLNKEKMTPFGPFLIIGTLLIYMFKFDVNSIINVIMK